MSPIPAPRDLIALPAVLAGAFVAAVALAGSSFGAPAVVLAVPAALLIGLSQRRAEARMAALRRLSLQDALTGLGNRRLLQQRLSYEIARHRRHERPLTVLALDLDGFKAVNDRYGHQAGDEVLCEIARALREAVRDQDTLARLGGDEFCVLAPESGVESAERMAARLRSAVRDAVGGLDQLAVSVGFAVFPDQGQTADELMAQADEAAIEAKRHARARRGRITRAA